MASCTSVAHNAPDALPAILCFSEPTVSGPPQSDVYRMLHDNRDEPTQPRQSGSFRVLQELVNDGPGEQPLLTEAVGTLGDGEDSKQTGNESLNIDFIKKSNESLPRTIWVVPGLGKELPGCVQVATNLMVKKVPKTNSILSSQGLATSSAYKF